MHGGRHSQNKSFTSFYTIHITLLPNIFTPYTQHLNQTVKGFTPRDLCTLDRSLDVSCTVGVTANLLLIDSQTVNASLELNASLKREYASHTAHATAKSSIEGRREGA